MLLFYHWIVEGVPDSSHLNYNGAIAQRVAQRGQPGDHLIRNENGVGISSNSVNVFVAIIYRLSLVFKLNLSVPMLGLIMEVITLTNLRAYSTIDMTNLED